MPLSALERLKTTNFIKKVKKAGFELILSPDGGVRIPESIPPDLRAEVEGQENALKELLQRPAWDAAKAAKVIDAALAADAVAAPPATLASRALRWEQYDAIDECSCKKDMPGLLDAAAKLMKLLEQKLDAERMPCSHPNAAFHRIPFTGGRFHVAEMCPDCKANVRGSGVWVPMQKVRNIGGLPIWGSQSEGGLFEGTAVPSSPK